MKNFVLALAAAIGLCAPHVGGVEKDAVSGLNLPPANTLADIHIDSLLNANKVIFIDGKATPNELKDMVDAIRRRISIFYYDQFHHFTDPDAPYFLFLSKDAQLAMGIGGAVRMRSYYDWGGAIPASGFAPYLIPMNPDPTNMKTFNTTPSGTCLFFRVLGSNKSLGEYQLYIEANFTGYQGRDLRLKKAYAILNDVTIGYAPSTFSDPMALPPTVDAQGPNNKINPTAVLVRYMPLVHRHWRLAFSVETPSAAVDIDNKATGHVSSWLPDFAAFAQYEWAAGQHVRLSGILRTLPYRNLLEETNHNVVGWGVQLSGVGHPAPMLTVYANAAYGQGYAGLGGDLLIGNYDLVADNTIRGRMYAPAMLGWCVGLQYNLRHNLFASVSTSMTSYFPHETEQAPSEYKRGLWGAANIFWNLTARISAAAEFDIARRTDFDGPSRWARRINIMAQFSF